MLGNKVIVYDDSCPMCRLYTHWFVAWGFLKAENRVGFAHAPDKITQSVDLNRARHEIPLFDRMTGETLYGLQALTHILQSRWRWLKPVFESRIFWWTFHPIYEVVTYNRRVIAGCKHCSGFDCAPDFNRFYRAVYVIGAAATASLMTGLLILCGTVVAKVAAISIVSFALVGIASTLLSRLTGGVIRGWNVAGSYVTTMVMMGLIYMPMTIELSGFETHQTVNAILLGTGLLVGINELRRRGV